MGVVICKRSRAARLQVVSHSSPALIPPPVKTIAAAAATFSVLAYFAARPIITYIVSRRLNTPLTIHTLNINPFRRRLTLSNVHLLDSLQRPLLSIPKLTISFPSVPEVVVTSPTVTAIFDTSDFSQSNWTLFTANLPTTAPQKPTAAPQKPTPAPSTSSPAPSTPDVRITIENALYLDLRTPQTSLPAIPLSPPPLSLSTITTPIEISRLITGLTSRALSYNLSSLPRDIRREARRYIRNALTEGVVQKVQVLKTKVQSLRKSVETADELLQDLPNIAPLQQRLKSAQSALKMFEFMLGGEPEKPSNEPIPQPSSPEAEQGYRELDEGDA